MSLDCVLAVQRVQLSDGASKHVVDSGIVSALTLVLDCCDMTSPIHRTSPRMNTPRRLGTRSLQVSAHKGPEEMGAALDGCDVVVIPAGVPRKPGMTR